MNPFRLCKPTPADLDAFLADALGRPYTYPDVGATLLGREPPEGWVVDRNRVVLGRGGVAFDAGCREVRRWTMFRLGWVETYPPAAPIAEGTIVAVVARVPGLWVVNVCRIVATIDDRSGPVARFGFSYGTLPGHVERGEERFLIEWDYSDDSVCYDILAFSRPGNPLVSLGRPFARRMQRRFAADTKRAMVTAVSRG
jgi:uncharacterized protein (UPF0548 family)